jgi:hypothetical protein
MTDTEETVSSTRRSGGPHLGALAIVSLALVALGLILGGTLSHGASIESPFATTMAVAERLREGAVGLRVAALLQFGAAIPLGIFAATAYARQLRLGVRVPGPVIGLFGGIFASVFAALSGLLTWLLSRPEVTVDGALAHAISFLSFLTGGVGYAVGLGLLVAGIAVPAFILRLLPRWLAGIGLVLALVGELSFLSLAVDPLEYLLPVARFGGLIWLVAVGFLLPRNRAAANRIV